MATVVGSELPLGAISTAEFADTLIGASFRLAGGVAIDVHPIQSTINTFQTGQICK